jgi:hypothetical protein
LCFQSSIHSGIRDPAVVGFNASPGSVTCQGEEIQRRKERNIRGETARYPKGTEIIGDMGQRMEHVVVDLNWRRVMVSSMAMGRANYYRGGGGRVGNTKRNLLNTWEPP